MGEESEDALNGHVAAGVIEKTGTGARRPSLRRDISHELEFTSFVNRRQAFKKTSVTAPPVSFDLDQRRQSFTDDLLKRAQFQRFFSSLVKNAQVQEERRHGNEIVNEKEPKMFQRRKTSMTSSEPGAKKLDEAEEASEENSSTQDPDRDIRSPSDVSVTILEKEPDLMAWRSHEENEIEQFKTMERRLSRARKLRRTTVMHYDQQEDTFRRRRAPQLFELAVLIDLEPNDGSNEKLFPIDKYAYVAKISFIYPTKTPQNLQPLLATLPNLCYADLGRARPENPERYKDEQFLMIITDTSGDRKYAYCHRFTPFDLSRYSTETEPTKNSTASVQSEKVLPQILCIVTPVNASSFYFDLTHEAALRAKSGNMKMLVTFLTQSFRHRLPPANGVVTVKLVDDENNEESSENADTGWEVVLVNRTTPKKGQGLGELLDRLGVEILLKLFCALLCEKRVLFVANSVPVLSRSVQAAGTMLALFDWPHTLIPVVPDPFLHLCYSPAPYLMGILRDHLPNLGTLLHDSQTDVENQEEYMLILDIDKAIVLKDKEWATTGSIDSASSPKLLPNRITRSLKQLLKSAVKNSEKREQKTTDAFQWTFVELIGHYREHVKNADSRPEFGRESFIGSPTSRSQRNFLKWFVETGMFQVWINKKLADWESGNGKPIFMDAFDRKLDQLKAAASDSRSWSWARF